MRYCCLMSKNQLFPCGLILSRFGCAICVVAQHQHMASLSNLARTILLQSNVLPTNLTNSLSRVLLTGICDLWDSQISLWAYFICVILFRCAFSKVCPFTHPDHTQFHVFRRSKVCNITLLKHWQNVGGSL